MTFQPGDILTETLSLVDNDSTGIPGAVFTTLRTADPNGASFALVYTELGSGAYRFTATTTNSSATGEWYALVRANDANEQVFSIHWNVQEAGRPDPYYVGQALVETLALVDTNNDPITGATFTTVKALGPDGTAITPTYVELGDGAYRFTVAATEVLVTGNYFALVQANDTQSQLFELEWSVSPTTVISYTMPTSGATRQEIRRSVLTELGDLVLTTTTAASGSSQWTDLDNLSFGDSGRYAGRDLYVTAGTAANVGQTRAISGSDGLGTLQLTRSLPEAVAANDEAEIVNTYGGAFKIATVHQAIDTAIRNAGTEVRIAAEISSTFDRETRTFDIPAAFTKIDTVQYVTDDADPFMGWRDVKMAHHPGSDGWWVDKADRTVVISDTTGYRLDGATIRIVGWGLPAAITSDDDICPVNAEWLVAEVASKLLLRAVGTSRSISPEWERKGFYLSQQAEKLRDLVRPRRSPNHVRL